MNWQRKWAIDNLAKRQAIVEHLRELGLQAHVVVATEIIDVAEQQLRDFVNEYGNEFERVLGMRILKHRNGGQIVFGHLRGGTNWLRGHKMSYGWVVLLPSTYEIVDAIREVHSTFTLYKGEKAQRVYVSQNY